MSNELFFDINEDQQQAVAGGTKSIYDELYTKFDQYKEMAMLDVKIASTKDGSAIDQSFAFDYNEVYTDAFKYFEFQ